MPIIAIERFYTGRNLFPATGYLFLVWEVLSTMHGKMYMDMKIVLENIKFIRATTVSKDSKVEFVISISKSNGHFEVTTLFFKIQHNL